MLPGAKVTEKAEELYNKLTVGWGMGEIVSHKRE